MHFKLCVFSKFITQQSLIHTRVINICFTSIVTDDVSQCRSVLLATFMNVIILAIKYTTNDTLDQLDR